MNQFLISLLAYLGANSLILVLLWVSKNWLIERLSRSIQHEYDKKLYGYTQKVKREYDRISLLQSETIKNLSSLNQFAHTKKLEAIQNLWLCMVSIKSKALPCFLLADILEEDEYSTLNSNPKSMELLHPLNDAKILEMLDLTANNPEEVRFLRVPSS